MALLIETRAVVTMAAGDGGVVDRGAVLVEGDRIAAVGPAVELAARWPGTHRLDLGDRIALPGLVNAHTHTDLLLLKGLCEQVDLHGWDADPWLMGKFAFLDTPPALPALEKALRAGYAQMASGGITCVGEFSCADQAWPVAVEVLRELGLAGAVVADKDGPLAQAPMAAGFQLMGHLPEEESLAEEDLLAAESWIRNPTVRWTMHAAETRHRIELAEETFGMPTIRLLASRGLLGPRAVLSHAVHVDVDEVGLIAAARAGIVASPVAEMKLSDGVSPLTAYLEAGVPVGLGTDCALCNNGCDLFLEMKTACLLQKLVRGPAVLPPQAALTMATLGGARLFGLEGEIGSLEPGKRADLCLIDATGPALTPLFAVGPRANLLANLVHSATAADVTDTMARGRWVVRDRRLVEYDEARLWAELQEVAETVAGL